MEARRYRQTGGHHSRSNSYQDYSSTATERPPSSMVTPTNQINSGRSRHAPPPPPPPQPHLDHHATAGHHHHHHYHHHHHHKQSREVFDDDEDNNSADNDVIQRDPNGGFGDNFEIPYRMLRMIMPEIFEHLDEVHNDQYLAEAASYSNRYTAQDPERVKPRLDIDTVRALNKQRVASLAEDAWIFESEEDPNLVRPRKQLYQPR
ncbi:hypothetical protein ABW19_dt0206717 [Dactylella cylindrospora]|nr:hypothetical protein ABW19_dt0206717 [Dactylella cylindrospora]